MKIRVPHPLWISLTTASLAITIVALRFAAPGYRQQVAVAALEQAGAEVYTVPGEPRWMETLLSPWLKQKLAIVTRVNLTGVAIDDALLAHLRSLPDLVQIGLSDTSITDEGLSFVSHLHDLQILELENTRVSDEGLVHLRNLTSLKVLVLNRTRVTDAGLAHLKPLSRLELVFLTQTAVTAQAVDAFYRELPAVVLLR